jgi:hypothetical protein
VKPFILLLLLLASARADAQCGQSGPASPPPVRGAIVGLITDYRNYPLERVEVILAQPKRKVSTNSRGLFTIGDLPPGTYPIIVRRIGYEPGTAEIVLDSAGATARICIGREPTRLAPLVASVSRGGLSGKVGDASFAPLAGAEVRAIGSNKSAVTDSAGAFFLDVRPGKYGLQVTKKGFGTRVVAVTIPRDSGREVSVWMQPMSAGMSRRMAGAISDMKMRYLMWGTGHTLYSSEDLATTSRSLGQIVGQRAVTKPADDCNAVVDGMYVMPMWALNKEDIELMEVYPGSLFSHLGQNSMQTRSAPTVRGTNTNPCSTAVYVWMKK